MCPYVDKLSKVKYFEFLNPLSLVARPLPPPLSLSGTDTKKGTFFMQLPKGKKKDGFLVVGELRKKPFNFIKENN